MFYKPSYCCNCGDKIERIEWNPLTSRRFCEICETDNPLDKLLKIIFPTVLLVFGVFGISGYFRAPEKSVGIIKTDQKSVLPNIEGRKPALVKSLKSTSERSFQKDDNESDDFENKKNSKTPQSLSEQSDTPNKQVSKDVVIATSPQKSAAGTVYFCGAETKKGTPCSRKVKGGGRCWQHIGREAILSAQELKIGN